MTVVQAVLVEDRLREAGWVYGEMPHVGCRWQHFRFPNDGFSLSDALYLEWQDALVRAGRSEHAIQKLRSQLALLCLGLIVAVVSTIFATGVAYFK